MGVETDRPGNEDADHARLAATELRAHRQLNHSFSVLSEFYA